MINYMYIAWNCIENEQENMYAKKKKVLSIKSTQDDKKTIKKVFFLFVFSLFIS